MEFYKGEKKYNTLNDFYRYKFGKKVFKVSLNAGFTCPNRDGSLSSKGCIFCSPSGSGDFAGNVADDLLTQFKNVKDRIHKKWPDALYIAYFQANTNTYAHIDKLKELYELALTLDENIVGLSISTRPDCIDDTLIDYLEELSKRTYLTIELGLQSIHDETTKFINRGHNTKSFDNTVKKLRKKNINTVVHIINGLPNETKKMMIDTVKYLTSLDIQGIKIHMLHVMKKTILGRMYLEKPFKLLSLFEYVDIVCDQLELINKDIVIHRLTGDSPEDLLIEPSWILKKFVVLNEIDKELKKRNTYQGIYYKES